MVLLAASIPDPPLLFTINASIEFCFLVLLIIVSSARSLALTSSRRRDHVAPSGSKLMSFTTIFCGLIGLIYLCTFLRMLYFFLESNEAFNSYLIWVYFVLEAISWIVLAFTVNNGVESATKTAIHAWWVTNLIINTVTVVWTVGDIIFGQALTIYSILSIAQWLASWFLISCLVKIRRQNSSQSSHLTGPLLGDEISSGHAVSDLDTASFFDRATFKWLNPLLVLGYSKPLVQSDIPFLPRHDRTEIAAAAFLEALELQKKNNPSKKPSVWRALAQCYGYDLLFTGLLALIRTLSLSVTPLFLFAFVNNAAVGQSRAKGFIIIIGLFLTKVIQSFMQRHWSFQSRYIIAKSRSAVMAACYEKELRLSTLAKQRHAAGEILSYIGVDAYRLGEFLWWMHYMWVAVLQVLIALAILFNIIGFAAFSCILVLFISAIVQIPVSRLLQKAQTNLMQAQDKRLRSITEILNSMKIIKLQSWENEFKAMVNEHRETELKWLWGMHSSRSYAGIVFWLTYVVGITSTLAVYALLGNEFTAAVIFTVFSAFANTQEPAKMIPEIIAIFSQVVVSVRRLDIFLQDEEFAEGAVDKETLKGSDFAIRVTNASFSWDAEASNLTLKGISLHVKHGQKVAISGAVGSGKSSLLMTILGEIPKIDGSVQVNGRIAYVAQTAWIQSGTIKDNILFGQSMNEVKYKEVLHACALVQDIDNFPHGDLTEIGERGLNMSGGQKQRIQLARAVYNDADIYLLDDPFSAVDAQTAATLFNECVMNALSRKTVVLVTHQVEFLPAVDHILVLEEGEIQQAGQYDQLLQAGQVFEKLVNAHKVTLDTFNKNSADEIQKPQKSVILKHKKEDGNACKNDEALDIMSQLTTKELKEIGDVGIQPYRDYIVISKGFLLFIFDVLGQGGQVSLQVMGGLWLAIQVMNPHINSTRLVGGYAVFAYASSISFLVRLRVHVMLGVKASSAFFSLLIDSMFKAPMGFFDATPTGRILSRVSSDMSLLDIDVIQISGTLLAFLFDLPGVLIVLLVVKWEIIIVMIPLLYIVLRIEIWNVS